MSDIFQILVGVLLGALATYTVYSFFNKRKGIERTEKQAVVLLEKIKTVAKLVVVEGELAEIYHHKHDKSYLFGMFSSEKKALLLVNAKVHIGFDLKKIVLDSDSFTKRIILKEFPQPEVLSYESSYKFYDIEEGIFNKFKPEEISQLNEDAKQFVLDKIPQSSLMQTAKKEALQSIQIMESIVSTIGWKLDYSVLKVESSDKVLLNR